MIKVSIKVPNIAIVPCRTGLLVSAAACAIGAEPKPASLEKMPRAIPIRSANIRVAPAKPPVAAAPLNALSTTKATAAGISDACVTRIISVAVMYNRAIKGTSFPATMAIRLIPPNSTTPTSTAITTPLTAVGTLKLVCSTWDTALD